MKRLEDDGIRLMKEAQETPGHPMAMALLVALSEGNEDNEKISIGKAEGEALLDLIEQFAYFSIESGGFEVW